MIQTPMPIPAYAIGGSGSTMLSGMSMSVSGLYGSGNIQDLQQEPDGFKWHKSTETGRWYLLSAEKAIKARDVNDYIV